MEVFGLVILTLLNYGLLCIIPLTIVFKLKKRINSNHLFKIIIAAIVMFFGITFYFDDELILWYFVSKYVTNFMQGYMVSGISMLFSMYIVCLIIYISILYILLSIILRNSKIKVKKYILHISIAVVIVLGFFDLFFNLNLSFIHWF